jgi:chemotaxis protein MotB
MKKLAKEKPVRIIRKKIYYNRHHGGAWKVAYADFVTAMMALFIVLWVNGQSKTIKDNVSEYFHDPIAFNDKVKSGILPDQKPGKGAIDKGASHPVDEAARFSTLAEKIKKGLNTNIRFKDLKNQIVIEFVKEGMRIELLESSKAFFFNIGTAKLNPEAEQILSVLGAEIGKMPNHIIIEGHTDSRPYPSTDGYTNYELSADRANAARRVLLKNGIRDENIDHVRGYANKKLRNTNDPYDITNRRISIIVQYEGAGKE